MIRRFILILSPKDCGMDDSRGGRARLPRLVHECFLGVGRISCLLYFEFDVLICFMHSKISGFVF